MHYQTTEKKLTSNNGVGGGNGGNNVLDDTLCQAVSDSLNIVLLRAGEGSLIKPLNILGIIGIHLALYCIMSHALCNMQWVHVSGSVYFGYSLWGNLNVSYAIYHHACWATRGYVPTQCSARANGVYWRWCTKGIQWVCSTYPSSTHSKM